MENNSRTTSRFLRLREYLENVKVGEVVSRQDIRKLFGVNQGESSGGIDNYRRLFCKAHYFSEYDPVTGKHQQGASGGYYIKIKEFDKEIVKSVKSLRTECEMLREHLFNKKPMRWTREEVDEFWQWDTKWKESGLNAKEFIHQNRGRLVPQKFGF